MSKAESEFEVYQAREGCRWVWRVWRNGELCGRGVEDTARDAIEAALKAYELGVCE